eukprot:m.11819 g.11819  ORF g.11819 m.11819 type:complete len:76 (+) comp7045_c0_seq3:1579-1806(+)
MLLYSSINNDEYVIVACDGGKGPLNPLSDETYKVIKMVIAEIGPLFSTSKYFHVGGDEFDRDCWNQNPGTLNSSR